MEFEEIKKTHDTLRESFLSKLSYDYSYPETEGGCICGEFTSEPDFDVLLKTCEYACSQGTTTYDGGWKTDGLFSLLKKLISERYGNRYDICLDFGGATPILALLAYLWAYSRIDDIYVDFTHDKWEARGDYSSNLRVGFKLIDGKIAVAYYRHEPYSYM